MWCAPDLQASNSGSLSGLAIGTADANAGKENETAANYMADLQPPGVFAAGTPFAPLTSMLTSYGLRSWLHLQ